MPAPSVPAHPAHVDESPLALASDEIAFMSSPDSVKSEIAKFSAICDGVPDRGIAATPRCCTCQRSTTCDAVRPSRRAMARLQHPSSGRQPERRIGTRRRGHAAGIAAANDRALVETRMIFALVGDQRFCRKRNRLLEHRARKIRHADMAARPRFLALQSAAMEPRSGMAAFGQWISSRSDGAEIEIAQARFRRSFERAGRYVVAPDLRREENVVALHAARTDAFSTCVHSHFAGRVDVAITDIERGLHRIDAGSSAQLPGAEAERGMRRHWPR